MSEAFGWTLLYVNYDCITYLKNKSSCRGVCVYKASCPGPGPRADPRVRGQHCCPDMPTTRPDPRAPRRRGAFPCACAQAGGGLATQSAGEALPTLGLGLWAVGLGGLQVVRCGMSGVPAGRGGGLRFQPLSCIRVCAYSRLSAPFKHGILLKRVLVPQ